MRHINRQLPTLLLFLCAVIVNQFASQRVWAQAASAGMTLDQLKAIKEIKIGNLEKDTYFKAGGYILDRYEERPAYVFNYSDGIPRKIYLYKVYTAADTKELGLLAIYQNGKTNQTMPFVIPGATADRKAWDAYIDDLKYVGEKEAGLMSALGFVLSREMALLMGGGGPKEEGGDKKKEEYNFCFPPHAQVSLANRQTKAIQDIKPGDAVMAYANGRMVTTQVREVQVHEAQDVAITAVWLTASEEVTASTRAGLTAPILLEATANHPVLTATGQKRLGDLRKGDMLYRYDEASTAVVVWTVADVQAGARTVKTVYNLVTEQGSFVVSDFVVLDK
ncbi:hypothetical protein GCM10023189_15480 [Nibrella saemangeumensis]|uniref:Hint domain-containing protein n=1 Tax=Nibrella saemangeumensis TaxID=1084526 RepID=A0ABP8MNI2_9BACT